MDVISSYAAEKIQSFILGFPVLHKRFVNQFFLNIDTP